MKFRAEVEFEVPEETCLELRQEGVGVAGFLHDEIDMRMNFEARDQGYSVVGIRLKGIISSGTLYKMNYVDKMRFLLSVGRTRANRVLLARMLSHKE